MKKEAVMCSPCSTEVKRHSLDSGGREYLMGMAVIEMTIVWMRRKREVMVVVVVVV